MEMNTEAAVIVCLLLRRNNYFESCRHHLRQVSVTLLPFKREIRAGWRDGSTTGLVFSVY